MLNSIVMIKGTRVIIIIIIIIVIITMIIMTVIIKSKDKITAKEKHNLVATKISRHWNSFLETKNSTEYSTETI